MYSEVNARPGPKSSYYSRVARHLEIIDHNHGRGASAEHNVELFGKRQIGVPMRIKIDEQRTMALTTQRSIEECAQTGPAVVLQQHNVWQLAQASLRVSEMQGVTFNGIDGKTGPAMNSVVDPRNVPVSRIAAGATRLMTAEKSACRPGCPLKGPPQT